MMIYSYATTVWLTEKEKGGGGRRRGGEKNFIGKIIKISSQVNLVYTKKKLFIYMFPHFIQTSCAKYSYYTKLNTSNRSQYPQTMWLWAISCQNIFIPDTVHGISCHTLYYTAMVTRLTWDSWHSIWNIMSPNVLRLCYIARHQILDIVHEM